MLSSEEIQPSSPITQGESHTCTSAMPAALEPNLEPRMRTDTTPSDATRRYAVPAAAPAASMWSTRAPSLQ